MGRLLGSRRCLFPQLTPIASLVLDFVNGIYSYKGKSYSSILSIPGATFSNATGGYADLSNGNVQLFAPNVPRVGKNGYVSELQGSNLCLSSQAFTNATIWNFTSLGSLADNVVTAPDGTSSGGSFVATAASAEFRANTITTTASQTYTLSFYVKLGTGGLATAQMKVATTGGVAIGTTPAITGANSTTWTRVSMTLNVGANTGVLIFPISATPQAGTYYIWGVQFELASAATSYIPTKATATTNLVQQSNYLATAPWTVQGGCTSANNIALAPDGSRTASQVTVTSNSGGAYQPVTVTASTSYTLSFYVKLGTATAGSYAVYNFSLGATITGVVNYPSGVNAQGWTRVSVTFTTPAATTSIGVYPWSNGNSNGTIFIWGVQLETGTYASTYVPVSPAVTNYCLYSQQIGTTGWTNSNGSATLNNALAPDGTTTATLYTTASTSATGSCAYRFGTTSVTVGQIVTCSVWVKAGVGQYAYMTANATSSNATAIFDVKNGVVTKTDIKGLFTSVTASISLDPRGSGWYRCAITFAQPTAATPLFQVGIASSAQPTVDTSGNVSGTAGNTLYFWGAQQEFQNGPNQYVLTTTANASASAQTSATLAAQTAFTRSPDYLVFGSALGLSFANTKAMVTTGSYLWQLSTNQVMGYLSNGTTTSFVLQGSYIGNYLAQINIAGSLVKSLYQAANIATPAAVRKQGISFGDNRCVVSQNGSIVNDTGNTNQAYAGTPSFDQLLVGGTLTVANAQMNGYVTKIQLYETALTQVQLNKLTQ